jgi:hypothetical protein
MIYLQMIEQNSRQQKFLFQKMAKIRVILLIICLLFVLSPFSQASENAGAFLENGLGARARAMGSAQVAISRPVDAMYWNPALLTKVSKYEFSLGTYRAFETNYISCQLASTVLGLDFGIGYLSAKVSDIEETSSAGSRTGNFFGYDAQAIFLAAAYTPFPKLSLGLTTKLLSEKLHSKKATGYGMDLGLLYTPTKKCSLGLNLQNIIAPSMAWNTASKTSEKIPLTIRAGLGLDLLESLTLGIDISRQKETTFYHSGLEWQFSQNLRVMAGWQNDSISLNNSQLSLGLGLKLHKLIIDFTYLPASYSYLDNIYQYSIGLSE